MNNKGFTLMEVLVSIVIMALIMMVVFPSVTKLTKNNNEKKYQTYEDMMVEYAIVNDDQTSEILKLSQLDELMEVKKECKGYVKVIDRNKNDYKAYISCGNNYETTDYDASLAD